MFAGRYFLEAWVVLTASSRFPFTIALCKSESFAIFAGLLEVDYFIRSIAYFNEMYSILCRNGVTPVYVFCKVQ